MMPRRLELWFGPAVEVVAARAGWVGLHRGIVGSETSPSDIGAWVFW
jgi:hypothetical protein